MVIKSQTPLVRPAAALGVSRDCCSSSWSAAQLIWETAINREGFGELNLPEFLVGIKGDEPHVADSALGRTMVLMSFKVPSVPVFPDFVILGQLC